MKTNNISTNCSFKALIVNKQHNATKNQQTLIKLINNSLDKNYCYVKFLEYKEKDIVISPNKDKKSVDVMIYQQEPFKILKKDNKELKVNIHVPNQSFMDNSKLNKSLSGNINYRIDKFINYTINTLYKQN